MASGNLRLTTIALKPARDGTMIENSQIALLSPFAYQTKLSRINDKTVHECVWYARTFEIPEEWLGRDLLLNFV